MMLTIVKWAVARLKEPSTWAGFAGLAAAAGISGEVYHSVAAVGVALAALAAMLLAEKSGPT